MAKIKKIQENGTTVYPVTISKAVKNIRTGKTLDEIILGDGQATAERFSFRPTAGEDRNVANTTYYEGERNGVARIEKVKGNSVVWNQKVHNVISPNDSGIGGWYVRMGINNATIQDDKITIYFNSGTSDVPWISQNIGLVSGHKYIAELSYEYSQDLLNDNPILFLEFCMTPSIINESRPRIWNNYANKKQTKGDVFCFFDGVEGCPWIVLNFVNLTANYLDLGYYATFSVKITDLTQMFDAGNEPTTIEELYARLPIGVDTSAYNAGTIINGNYNSIKTTGFNQWDEQWEAGTFDASTGNIQVSKVKIRSKNFIKVIEGAYYSLSAPNGGLNICLYDKDKKHIGSWFGFPSDFDTEHTSQDLRWNTGKIRKMPNRTYYIKFSTWLEDIYTYNNDICINIAWDEYAHLNGSYKPYKPFEKNLSWVAKYFPNGMRSAGSARDEIRFNSTTQIWEAVQRVGVVDLGSLTWQRTNSGVFNTTNSFPIADLKQPDIYSVNSICSKYIVVAQNGYNANPTCLAIFASGRLWLKDDKYTDVNSLNEALQGVMLNYELAEPIVTPITEDINLSYDITDYGTEQLIVTDGAQSAPLSAEVVYDYDSISTKLYYLEKKLEVVNQQIPEILRRLNALENILTTEE